MKSFFLILGTLFLLSCQGKKSNILQIAVRSVVDNSEQILLLSNVAETVRYIPLETNEQCLLRGVNNVYETKDFLFVSDYSKLFQFDKSGTFIKRIGVTGKGPGELGKRIRFDIDEGSNEIYIHSRKTQINVYDLLSGNFKRSFNTNNNINRIAAIGDSKVATFNYDMPVAEVSDNMFEVFVFDRAGKRIDSIPDYTRLNKNSNASEYINVYRRDGKVVYKSFCKDTLYCLNSDLHKEPYLTFKLDNPYNVEFKKEERFSEETKYPEFLSVYQTLECADYLYLTVQKGIKYGQNRDMRRMVYNKSTQKLIRVEGIKNDLDGGVSFWPKKEINGKLVAFVEAIDLIKHYQNHKTDEGISEEFNVLVDRLSVESNPVLMVVE